jgi:hypothetical protein
MINARALTLRFKGTDSEIVYQRLLQVYQWDHEENQELGENQDLQALPSSGGGVLGVWNTVSSSVSSITAPRYARDAVGRVVVEDGLVRMQPHGSGLRRPTLRAALEKIQSRKSGFWSTLSNRHVWFDKEVATVEEV